MKETLALQGNSPRILLLSGYDAASHKRWRDQLTGMFSDYHWHTLALPPRFFRWRIRGNPLTWLNEPALQERWDLVIATSMVDWPHSGASIPTWPGRPVCCTCTRTSLPFRCLANRGPVSSLRW
nr:DUF3524 domain-containing protein [uncultured Marinobacter sp.]